MVTTAKISSSLALFERVVTAGRTNRRNRRFELPRLFRTAPTVSMSHYRPLCRQRKLGYSRRLSSVGIPIVPKHTIQFAQWQARHGAGGTGDGTDKAAGQALDTVRAGHALPFAGVKVPFNLGV